MLVHGQWFSRTYPNTWYFFPAHIGWSGVDLFFVLSGFLITGILIRTKDSPNRAQSFYMRRVLRIFPLYYCALLVLFIAVHFSWFIRSEFPAHTWRGWLVYILYLQNFAFLHNSAYWFRNIVGHFWSLAVEEQFYFLWPWIVWAISPRAVIRICVLGVIASLAFRALLSWHFGPGQWVYEFALTPSRGEGLLVGSALAALSLERKGIPKRLLIVMAAVGVAILAAILLREPAAFVSEAGNVYIFTIGITAFNLIYGALVGSSLYAVPYLTAFLKWRWLRSFGVYSYGIYVIHQPFFHIAAHIMSRLGVPSMRYRYGILFFLLNVALSYGLAWLSYHLFEQRFLRLKDRFRPRPAIEPFRSSPFR